MHEIGQTNHEHYKYILSDINILKIWYRFESQCMIYINETRDGIM